MESELNKKIREILEMFGVTTQQVVGNWQLIGHLKNLIEEEKEESQQSGYELGYNDCKSGIKY
jgi:hypothetical protein